MLLRRAQLLNGLWSVQPLESSRLPCYLRVVSELLDLKSRLKHGMVVHTSQLTELFNDVRQAWVDLLFCRHFFLQISVFTLESQVLCTLIAQCFLKTFLLLAGYVKLLFLVCFERVTHALKSLLVFLVQSLKTDKLIFDLNIDN